MSGLTGPKAHEVRAGLGGPDPANVGKVVLTPVQSGRSTRADKDADRQNKGFSGTPLWKIKEQLQKSAASSAVDLNLQVPEGFTHHEGDWYWSERCQVFWRKGCGRFFVHDPRTHVYAELHEGVASGLSVLAGAACQDGPSQVRRVLVRDLLKAGQVLRMPIEHLDRPCALYALHEGHRGPIGGGNACTEFCAKHLHEKLLLKLSEFRGSWSNERLATAMREVFEALDADFLAKHADVVDGSTAVVALVTGRRLVVASVGDLACVLCLRGGEAVELIAPHIKPQLPSARNAEVGATDDVPPTIDALRLTRSFGNRDRKVVPAEAESGTARLSVTPDVHFVHLQQEHHGFVLLGRTAFASAAVASDAGGSGTVSLLMQRRSCIGRPRIAAGTLLDSVAVVDAANAPDAGTVSSSMRSGQAAIVVLFDGAEDSTTAVCSPAEGAEPPLAKRPRTEPQQVRVRHILVKFRDCKNPVDKVRNRPVTRGRWEAERLLRKVLEEFEDSEPQKRASVFSQRCREFSDCQSSLRGGDLTGDINWVRRGKMGTAFDDAAFALQVGQLSDLVDSDAGIHLIWRTG